MTRTITIPLLDAVLIRQNFLPVNPDDYHGIDQRTRKALENFIGEINRLAAQPVTDAVDQDCRKLLNTLTQ